MSTGLGRAGERRSLPAYGREDRLPRVMLTARVTETQAAALREYAGEVGLPMYQATVRALELGIAALVGGRGIEPARAGNEGEKKSPELELNLLHEAVDRLTLRAELSDRLNQRTLYAAGAAYAASLAGPTSDPERLAEITRDADRIFDRQLAKARAGSDV